MQSALTELILQTIWLLTLPLQLRRVVTELQNLLTIMPSVIIRAKFLSSQRLILLRQPTVSSLILQRKSASSIPTS